LKRKLRSNWSGKPGRRIAAMRPKTEKVNNISTQTPTSVADAKRPYLIEGLALNPLAGGGRARNDDSTDDSQPPLGNQLPVISYLLSLIYHGAYLF
jgi:hypothetical protein